MSGNKKKHVIDAVMTGSQAINVGTVRQYIEKSAMERKHMSLQKKSRPILILTQNQSERRYQKNQALRTNN